MLTWRLLSKDYAGLAACLIPISEAHRAMGNVELQAMLRSKARAFTEQELGAKFKKGGS
jgi:hypothetical protein